MVLRKLGPGRTAFSPDSVCNRKPLASDSASTLNSPDRTGSGAHDTTSFSSALVVHAVMNAPTIATATTHRTTPPGTMPPDSLDAPPSHQSTIRKRAPLRPNCPGSLHVP